MGLHKCRNIGTKSLGRREGGWNRHRDWQSLAATADYIELRKSGNVSAVPGFLHGFPIAFVAVWSDFADDY
jgi:hypothetical protein